MPTPHRLTRALRPGASRTASRTASSRTASSRTASSGTASRTASRALRVGVAGVLALVLVGCSDPAPAELQADPARSVSPAPSPSATASASQPASQPAPQPAPCSVDYTVTNQWDGQFQADVVLTARDAPVTGWTLSWSFADGQTVGQTWNATPTQESAAVSMTAVEHNTALAAGASATFGFIATWQGVNTVPTDFTLDGAPCAVPEDDGTGDGAGAGSSQAGGSPADGSPADGATAFYTSPTTQAAAAAQAATGETRTLLDKIALTPQALWVGDWSGADQARASVADHTGRAAAVGQVALVVVYAIPGRDCGNHSAGGVATSDYAAWIDTVASGITGSPWIILEPDALAQLGDCSGQGDRAGYLRYAAQSLSQAGGHVYIDAGHSSWLSAAEAARRLTLIGLDHAEGFALNTSNYQTTEASRAYGEEVSALVGGKPFVVDTSRNGTGPSGSEWCNPSGRGLGEPPRMVTDGTHLAGLVWAKAPGESDGSCNGGPAAGQWWQDGALELARNASW